MSLTVVVTRDYDDVPSCFEKYERGTFWRVNNGNLEVFADTTLVALYPSGNWISVYADDAMTLHKGGALPDYSTMPRVEAPPSRTSADDPVSDRHISRSRPNRVVEDPMYGPGGEHERYAGPPGSGTSPDIIPGEDVAAARAAMVPVSFRPRTYRTPAPAKKSPTGPRLLPIRLRMKRFRPPTAGTPPESTGPRMLPVQMRTTIYRAAREQPGVRPDPEATRDAPADDDA